MILLIFALAQDVKCSSSIKTDSYSAPASPISIFNYDPSNSGVYEERKMLEENKDEVIKGLREAMKDMSKDSEMYKSYDQKIKLYEAMLSFIVSTSTNDLSKIDKGTDLLVIYHAGTGKENDPFDFSKLSSPMRVVFVLDNVRNSKRLSLNDLIKAVFSSNLKNDDHSFLSFTITLISLTKSDSKETKADDKIFIKGDCKGKVMFTSFISGKVKFVGSNFTANCFFWKASIDETGKGLNSEYVMITDLLNIPLEFYPVRKLFMVIMNSDITGVYGCGIHFGKDVITLKDNSMSDCKVSNNYMFLKEWGTDQIGFISPFSAINMEVEDGVIDVPKFNISIQNYQISRGPFSRVLEDDKIVVTQTGPWDKVKVKPEIIIESSDPSKIEVATGVTGFTVKKQEIYTYTFVPESPKKGGLSVGAIVGIVIGCLAAVGIVVGVCVYFFVIKKKKTPVENN